MFLLRKLFNFFNAKKSNIRTWLFKRIVAQCGDISIFGHIDVINPRNIYIGEGCTINHGCYINAFNPIRIGNDVTLSANVSVISTGIDVENWMGGAKKHISNDGVEIGDHVWIGANAQILSGVHIKGPYVVIAAGAVVTKDINEPYCLYGGCPAKFLKKLK